VHRESVAVKAVIANEAKQSRLPRSGLDYFVASLLAITTALIESLVN